MFPPHIPPPSLSLRWHRLGRRIKVILVATIFGLAGGFTGAAILLGWGIPELSIGSGWVPLARENTIHEAQLDETTRRGIAEKLFSVYRSVTPLGAGGFLSTDNKVGAAVLVNADGWLAMPLPTGGFSSNWQVLGSDGRIYTIERSITDHFAGLVYFHIISSERNTIAALQELRRAAAFADQANLSDTVFINSSAGWASAHVVAITSRSLTIPHLDSAPGVRYLLSDSFNEGNVVVNSVGEFLGFITVGRAVVPLAQLAAPLPQIILTGKASYQTLGVDGWFSVEQPIIVNGVGVPGFMVNKVLHKKSLLRRGDIVREINGQPAASDALRAALAGTADIRLTVWRNGAVVNLVAPVLSL